MINVLISSGSRYPINRKGIRKTIEILLGQASLDDIEVSVFVVGVRKIQELNRVYRKLDESTDVLSFPLEESRGPDGFLRLGDIIVCYPEAVIEAAKENRMVDDQINFLVDHSMHHLLGEHHEE